MFFVAEFKVENIKAKFIPRGQTCKVSRSLMFIFFFCLKFCGEEKYSKNKFNVSASTCVETRALRNYNSCSLQTHPHVT
jgi:hypothetical protein